MALQVRPRIARPTDRGLVANLLAVTFTDTPLAAWLEPDAEARLAKLRDYFTALTAWYLDHGTVYVTGEGTGAALWVRSTAEQAHGPAVNAATCADIWQHGTERVRRLERARCRRPVDLARFERLAYLAVDEHARRRGHAGGLLAAHHTILDRASLPAVTEATDLRTLDLFTRSGYITGQVLAVEAGGPTLQQTIRFPQ